MPTAVESKMRRLSRDRDVVVCTFQGPRTWFDFTQWRGGQKLSSVWDHETPQREVAYFGRWWMSRPEEEEFNMPGAYLSLRRSLINNVGGHRDNMRHLFDVPLVMARALATDRADMEGGASTERPFVRLLAELKQRLESAR